MLATRRLLWLPFLIMTPLLTLAWLTRLTHAAATAAAPPLDVVVSEVAWMGTTAGSSDEWLELANNTATAVDLNGWRLVSSDGTPAITLAGAIPAGGRFLLERTDDTTTPVLADQLYTGALSNGGEVLTLTDALSNVIDVAGAPGPWFAGDNNTKETMVRQPLTASGTLPASWTNGPAGGTPTNSIVDSDGDGFGYSANIDWTAGAGPGYAALAEDCDDTSATVYPGAPELLDVADNDCDGEVDEDFVLGTLAYEVFFSADTALTATAPTTQVTAMEAALLDLIGNATTTIDVALYGFSRASLRDALIAAHNRGVAVRVVADDDAMAEAEYAPFYNALTAAGVPVIADTFSSLQHNKFAVVDGAVTWTGSTNWTDTGFSFNMNNSLLLTDTYIALAYTQEFAEMAGGRFGVCVNF